MDAKRYAPESATKRPCIYCGRLTRSLYQVCLDHDDLPALDDGARQGSE